MRTGKLLLMLSVITVLLLTSVPVSAKATRTSISITEYVCMNTPGQEWVAGNVYHLRGQIHENVMVVEGEIWAINTAKIDLDFNLATGQLVGRGYADIMPVGANGGYTGVGAFRFYGAGAKPLIGAGSLQGYGDLKGQFLSLDLLGESLPPDPVGDAYCAGHGDYFSTSFWSGYILRTDN